MRVMRTAEERGREALIRHLHADRWAAHQFLFPHRHGDEAADAHREIVALLYNPDPRLILLGFRGIGKSTLTEEAAVIEALLTEYKNMVIVGSSYDRACERLAAVKRELLLNEKIEATFGKQKGNTWQEGKIVLTNKVCVQALGRDQDLRGLKHLDYRPDCALVDDVEGREEVRTPEGRKKTRDWFLREFLPGLDDPVKTRVRMLATPMDPEALPLWLERELGWPTRRFPIYHAGADGRRRATWRSRFPLDKIAAIEHDYRGDLQSFSQEYLCVPVAERDRVFRREMFHVKQLERRWQPVYAMIDPARSTNRTSATTGWAVWSWLGRRLHVWAAGAGMYKPDEIIDLVFTLDEEFKPVRIGVEEDGLNEFIMQPLRHEQARRGAIVPVKAMRAPRGKLDFIRQLQNYYNAGEVTHQAPLPDLEAQLTSFPTGRIDAPNALAYALPMNPGLPVFECDVDEIVDEVEPDPRKPFYLAAHAESFLVTAVLLQVDGEEIRILADWVREGPPSEVVPGINAEAALFIEARWRPEARTSHDWREELKVTAPRLTLQRELPRWTVMPRHADPFFNVGLEQAIRRLPAPLMHGSEPGVGREVLRERLQYKYVRAQARASWVLRALSGGYALGLRKGGAIAAEAEAGPYRVLMEGLEAFAGMTAAISTGEAGDDDGQPIAYNRAGQGYKSALPQRR